MIRQRHRYSRIFLVTGILLGCCYSSAYADVMQFPATVMKIINDVHPRAREFSELTSSERLLQVFKAFDPEQAFLTKDDLTELDAYKGSTLDLIKNIRDRRLRASAKLLASFDAIANNPEAKKRIANIVYVGPSENAEEQLKRWQSSVANRLVDYQRISDTPNSIKGLVKQSFLDDDLALREIDPKELENIATNACLRYFDRNCAIVPSYRRHHYSRSFPGFRISESNAQLIVSAVYMQSMLNKPGLSPGDRILQIKRLGQTFDAIGVMPWQIPQLSRRLERRENTTVDLHIIGNDSQRSHWIEMSGVGGDFFEPISATTAGDENCVGYLNLAWIGRDEAGTGACTSDLVKSHIAALVKKRVRGLVLDLRGSQGIDIEEAGKVIAFFIDKGTYGLVKKADGTETELSVAVSDNPFRLPIVVVLDESVSGTGEIVAAALKDRANALLLGSRSAGLSPFRSAHTLDDEHALLCTNAIVYRMDGRPMQPAGIQPDFTIDMDRNKLVAMNEGALKAIGGLRLAPETTRKVFRGIRLSSTRSDGSLIRTSGEKPTFVDGDASVESAIQLIQWLQVHKERPQ